MKNTQHLSMSIVVLEKEIVNINMRLNQAVRQQLARTLSDVTIKF